MMRTPTPFMRAGKHIRAAMCCFYEHSLDFGRGAR